MLAIQALTFALLAQEAPPSSPLGGMLLPMVLMFGVVYFLIIRPNSRRDNARRERINKIDKGDEVVLVGGIFGRISSIDEKIAVVEIADRVKIKVLRREIADTQEEALKEPERKGKAAKDAAKSDDKETASKRA
jgi:preprotein translocase subunit YajC